MPNIIGATIFRGGASIARHQILQKFDSGTRLRAQSGDAQARPGNIVEMFLLDAAVHAFARDIKAQQISIVL